MFALLLALSTAWATNLCGLTQSQVTGVSQFYNWGMTYSQILPYIAAPIECSAYGDLCEDVGEERAEEFICDRWAERILHTSEAVILANGDAELDLYEDEWFDEQWPDGIPSEDDWWGDVASLTGGCTRKDTQENSGDTRRIRTKAHYTLTVAYNEIGAKVKAMKKKSNGNWKRDKDASVSIDGTFVIYGESLTCEDGDDDSGTNGKAKIKQKGGGSGPPEELIYDVAGHGYSLTSEEVCRDAPWHTGACP
jgi:hypothetical protein